MKDLFRIVRHRFLKNNKKAVSTLAVIITFVMVYTLIMPAVALERKAAENEPGIALEETVSGDAMAEAEPASLEAEEVLAEESESDAEAVSEEESAAEEIEAESDVPAAVPEAEDTAVNSGSDAADASAAIQNKDATTDQGSFQGTDAANEFDGNQSAAEDSADPSVSDADHNDAEEGMPAQKFEQTIRFNEIIDEEGNTVEKQVKVKVDAEKNAFPAGTVMKAEVVLSNIDPQRLQDMEDAIKTAVKKAADESGLNADSTRVVQYQAIDINFFNKEGQKIEPAKKVEVRITSDKIREIENPVLVHVNENEKTGEIKNADVIEKKDVSIIDEKPDTVENNENTMLFKTSRFSPFVIVESETVDEDGEGIKGLPGEYENGVVDNDVADGSGVLMTSDGDYNVTVTYDANANIPANAELQVNEITEASRAYQNYIEEAKDVLEDDAASINYAKIFDVDIVSDGEIVTPEAEVDVDIAYKNSDEIEEGTVVQALQFGEGTPAVNDDAFVYGDETHIDGVQMKAVEIPVTAIVGTSLTEEITLPGSDDTYEVNVTFGPDAKIPQNAKLSVKAIDSESKEYNEAKEAVIEAKKAADDSFDETDLGFAALDISIFDENGNKVEPAKGSDVKVSIKLKKLPGGTDEESLNNTLEVLHLNDSTGTVVVETVASAEDVTVENGSALAEFTIDSFSVFPLTWSDGSATVHFGDITSGEFDEFENDKVATFDTSVSSISVDNNFDGYIYSLTHYVKGEVDLVMEPILYKVVDGESYKWQADMRIPDEHADTTHIERRDIELDSDIYVEYVTKTPGNEYPASGDDIEGPTTDKSITANKNSDNEEDGTYAIQLDIKAPVKREETKVGANVMIVLDRTKSMRYYMDRTGTAIAPEADNRWTAAKAAIDTLVTTLSTGENAQNDVEYSLITFIIEQMAQYNGMVHHGQRMHRLLTIIFREHQIRMF